MAETALAERFIRVHHRAFYDWLRGCKIDYGEVPAGSGNRYTDVPIIVTRAGIEQAFASVGQLLLRTGWIPGATRSERQQNASNYELLPSPFCTYDISGDPMPDTVRGYGVPLSDVKKHFDEVTQTYTEYRMPRPWRCSFTVNMFCRKRYTEQFFREWVYAQFGAKGNGNSEVLIPVKHSEPWGTLYQSLKFTSSSDNSELEGSRLRFIRTSFNFELDMWMFYPPVSSPTVAESDRRTINVPSLKFGKDNNTYDRLSKEVYNESYNLVDFPLVRKRESAVAWRKSIGTTAEIVDVTPSDSIKGRTVKLTLDASIQFITLADGLPSIAGNSGLLSVSFAYRSEQPFDLLIAESTGAVGSVPTQVVLKTMPATSKWKKLHLFANVTKPIMYVNLETTMGSPASTIYVHRPDVRTIYTDTKYPPTDKIDLGTHWLYVWRGISESSKVIMFKATHASVETIEVVLDVSSPAVTKPTVLDSTTNAFQAGIIVTPTADSIGLRAPKNVLNPSVYMLNFKGYYAGNTA